MKLPPIEYFYGRTPLAIWISKCKPFKPKEVHNSIQFKPIPIPIPVSDITLDYLQETEKDFKTLMNEYFCMNEFLKP